MGHKKKRLYLFCLLLFILPIVNATPLQQSLHSLCFEGNLSDIPPKVFNSKFSNHCEYSTNPEKCSSCFEEIEKKNISDRRTTKILKITSLILFILSIITTIYLVIELIHYIIKKKVLVKKLIPLAIGMILLVILFFFWLLNRYSL